MLNDFPTLEHKDEFTWVQLILFFGFFGFVLLNKKSYQTQWLKFGVFNREREREKGGVSHERLLPALYFGEFAQEAWKTTGSFCSCPFHSDGGNSHVIKSFSKWVFLSIRNLSFIALCAESQRPACSALKQELQGQQAYCHFGRGWAFQ